MLQANGPFGGRFSHEVWGMTLTKSHWVWLSPALLLTSCMVQPRHYPFWASVSPSVWAEETCKSLASLFLCSSLSFSHFLSPSFLSCSHSPPLPALWRAWATLGSNSIEWWESGGLGAGPHSAANCRAVQQSPLGLGFLASAVEVLRDQNYDWFFKNVKCSPGASLGEL